MYSNGVKTITITIPEDLDGRAVEEARRRGVSKSELIREGLQFVLPRPGEGNAGPEKCDRDLWHSLAGFGADGISSRPDEVDEILYGSR